MMGSLSMSFIGWLDRGQVDGPGRRGKGAIDKQDRLRVRDVLG